jgi:hypothetical protein
MTQLLILGTSILAQAPIVDSGDTLRSADAIYPKSVIAGYQLVDAALPPGFSPAAYSWNGSAVVANPLPAATVPQTVSRFQGLAALSNAGLLTQAQAAVNASANPLVALAWNNSATFDRQSPTMLGIAAALGLTSSQVDELFISAAQLRA